MAAFAFPAPPGLRLVSAGLYVLVRQTRRIRILLGCMDASQARQGLDRPRKGRRGGGGALRRGAGIEARPLPEGTAAPVPTAAARRLSGDAPVRGLAAGDSGGGRGQDRDQRMSKAAFMEPLPALSKLAWKASRHCSNLKNPVRSPWVG